MQSVVTTIFQCGARRAVSEKTDKLNLSFMQRRGDAGPICINIKSAQLLVLKH